MRVCVRQYIKDAQTELKCPCRVERFHLGNHVYENKIKSKALLNNALNLYCQALSFLFYNDHSTKTLRENLMFTVKLISIF